MLFSEIPTRTNKDYIIEEWFNTLRQAGIDSQGQVGAVTVVSTEIILAGGYYLADSSGGTFALNLPNPTTGSIITIKKISSDSNDVRINRFLTDKIEGENADYIITTQFEAITLITDGTDWYIV